MTVTTLKLGLRALSQRAAALSLITLVAGVAAMAQERGGHFTPGNMVVSRSVYDNNPNNVKVGTILPPNCANTTGGCSAATGAPNNGTYPGVFNNNLYDGSFGITSKIFWISSRPGASSLIRSKCPTAPIPESPAPPIKW